MPLTEKQIEGIEKAGGKANTPQATGKLLTYLHEHFPKDVAVISSFGAESVALLAQVAKINAACPIFFLDTGRHFQETLDYRDKLIGALGLKDVRTLHPDADVIAFEDPDGLMAHLDPDRCCEIRKVQPLARVEKDFDIWITGRKRGQASTRKYLPVVDPQGDGRIKVNPLAGWSETQIQNYIQKHHLPVHPLVECGYRSIGCKPCTRAVKPGEDARAGRWPGKSKTECGLHRSFDSKHIATH